MIQKRAFLLARAHRIDSSIDLRGRYDEDVHLNMDRTHDHAQPLVLTKGGAVTRSKTDAAPGDDDPDIEAEECY